MALPQLRPGQQEISHIKKGPINISSFFANNNHWILYKGLDTNIPCGGTLYLISYQPMICSADQMRDFDQQARPDFTIKPLGRRELYENKKTNKKDLNKMKDKRKSNDEKQRDAEKKRKAERDKLREKAKQDKLKKAMNGDDDDDPRKHPGKDNPRKF